MDADSCFEFQNVRITPKSITFSNPYNGKEYKAQIVIQNVGHVACLIRILNATSSGVSLKTIERGQFLSPGLKIVRNVDYMVNMTTLIETCTIPIYINEKLYNFPITVSTRKIPLRAEPAYLDFGVIDTGPSPTRLRIKLINEESQPCRFHIDLGPNALNLMVDPMKGIVMADSCVEMQVDLTLLIEGRFISEFWIIAEMPICMKVVVNAKHGHITTLSRFSMESFTFLHFPITYYGLTSKKIILLKNDSNIGSLFCITGCKHGNCFHLNEAPLYDLDYYQFNVEPKQGRLFRNDIRIFTFTFAPKKKYVQNDPDYFLVMIRINKLYCRDLNPSDYEDSIFGTVHKSSSTISRSTVDIDTYFEELFEDEVGSEASLFTAKEFFSGDVHVMLYANAETPNVTILPDELSFYNLTNKVAIKRVLQIKNESSNLPIIVQYKKLTFVEIQPKQFYLKPLESYEVAVTITPQSYDVLKSAITFNLLYYDEPHTNEPLKIVGVVKVPIIIHEKIVTVHAKTSLVFAKDYDFPKGTPKPNALIYNKLVKENATLALPDDRPQAIRRWKSEYPCKTLYAGLPRVCDYANDYELSMEKMIEKAAAKLYYRKEIRKQAQKLLPNPVLKASDYEISSRPIKCASRCRTAPTKNEICAHFIPLSPYELYNISITPRNTIIQNVAPKSTLPIQITISNDNNLSLRIYLKSEGIQYFTFPQGTRFEINEHESIQINYAVYAHMIGLQNYILDVIINECNVFETTITVHVVPTNLYLSTTELTFKAKEMPYKYFVLQNKQNLDIDFEWETIEDFIVEPLDGTVRPGNSLVCLIQLDAIKCTANNYELVLKVAKSKFITVRVVVDLANQKFVVPHQVTFGANPSGIRVRRSLTIENQNLQSATFFCDTSSFIDGLTVIPVGGVLEANAVQTFNFSLDCNVPKTFSCAMILIINDTRAYNVTIQGDLVFPHIEIAQPEIRFRKIAASGFDVSCFTISNKSAMKAHIEFDVTKLADLYITEQFESKYLMTNNILHLNAHTEKSFMIHYYPSYPEIKWFYLPITVNGIANKTSDLHMPKLKLYCSTYLHKLIIKSWSYFFTYYNDASKNAIQSHEIVFTNGTHGTLTFCLRLDYLSAPFRFEHVNGGNITTYNYSIVIELAEQDASVTFHAQFTPTTYGVSESRIPVYIRDDYNEDVHNYLYFKGMYYPPEFQFPDEIIHFGFIPLELKVYRHIQVQMKDHKADCSPTLTVDNPNVDVAYKMVYENGELRVVEIKLRYYSISTNILDCFLDATCTCGAARKIKLCGGAENSYFTIYDCIEYFRINFNIDTYLLMKGIDTSLEMKNAGSVSNLHLSSNSYEYNYETDYPLFPQNPDEYTKYLNRIVDVVEQWVCDQGFYGTRFYKIPDTIAMYEVIKNNDALYLSLPFYKFFQNICSFKRKLVDMKCDSVEDAPILITMLSCYTHLLALLQEAGAMTHQIQPESLLTYHFYNTFMDTFNPTKAKYSFEKFYLWSKRTWLDLLLQTYKVLVFKRVIKLNTVDKGCGLIGVTQSAYAVQTSAPLQLYSNIFCAETALIISLINNDYMTNRKRFARKEFVNCTKLPEKTVVYFNDIFADGIILAAITLTYCPFMEKYFHGLYLEPKTHQECFYNAYALINVWDMLNISFHMKPNDIIESNPVQMLMLFIYLYDFLPHFRPRKNITLSSELMQECEVDVLIANENKDSINYNISIFGNDDNLYKTSEERITIKPNSEFKLQVYFAARFITAKDATLVLKGEMRGIKFTHGRSFILQGVVEIGRPYVDLTLNYKIYTIKSDFIRFKSPHLEDCTYDLYFTLTPPDTSFANCKMIPLKEYLDNKTFARVKLSDPYFESVNGEISKQMYIFTIRLNAFTVYLIARNSKVGDFYIQLTIQVMEKQDIIPIHLDVPGNFFECPCTCVKKINVYGRCPRVVALKIPSKNEFLWSGLLEYFYKYRGDDETEFWNFYKESPVGMQVLKRLLIDIKKHVSISMAYIFEPTYHFDVISRSSSVVMEKEVNILNSLSTTAYTEILVHINSKLDKFVFQLHDINEKRYYNVYIDVTKESVTTDM